MRTRARLLLLAWGVALGLMALGVGGLGLGHLRPAGAFALAAPGFLLATGLLGAFMWGSLAEATTRPLEGGETERLWRIGLILALGPAGAVFLRLGRRRR